MLGMKIRVAFASICVSLCANLFATGENAEDWREWTLLESPERTRAFLSGARPAGTTEPVLAGEISPKTKVFEAKWKLLSGHPFSPKNYESPEAWEKQVDDAYDFFCGWTLPFADYCLKSGDRRRFASCDILQKSELALSLMEVAVRSSGERSREHWEMGANLFSDLLREFRPGRANFLEAEIDKTDAGFEKRTQNIFLERARFDYYRQRELQKILKFGHITRAFLAGLSRFLNNDIEAQMRFCAKTGIAGKLELSRQNRPDLCQEAISNYQEEDVTLPQKRIFVSGDSVPVFAFQPKSEKCFSEKTTRVLAFSGHDWQRAARRISEDSRLDLTAQESSKIRLTQALHAVPVLSGWKIPFEEFCGENIIRHRFSTGDILLKQSVLRVLMSREMLKNLENLQAARMHWECGLKLFSELLDEYHPGVEEQLREKIEKCTENDFSPLAKNTAILNIKFNYERQKSIREFLENGFIQTFFSGLRYLYGNDIEEQRRIYDTVGIRGKIDLMKFGRTESIQIQVENTFSKTPETNP